MESGLEKCSEMRAKETRVAVLATRVMELDGFDQRERGGLRARRGSR